VAIPDILTFFPPSSPSTLHCLSSHTDHMLNPVFLLNMSELWLPVGWSYPDLHICDYTFKPEYDYTFAITHSNQNVFYYCLRSSRLDFTVFYSAFETKQGLLVSIFCQVSTVLCLQTRTRYPVVFNIYTIKLIAVVVNWGKEFIHNRFISRCSMCTLGQTLSQIFCYHFKYQHSSNLHHIFSPLKLIVLVAVVYFYHTICPQEATVVRHIDCVCAIVEK